MKLKYFWASIGTAAAVAVGSPNLFAGQLQAPPNTAPPPAPPLQATPIAVPPPPIPISAQGKIAYSFVVETDGRVTDCRFVEATGELAGGTRVGPAPCPERYTEPYRDSSGNAVRKRVTIRRDVIWEELP